MIGFGAGDHPDDIEKWEKDDSLIEWWTNRLMKSYGLDEKEAKQRAIYIVTGWDGHQFDPEWPSETLQGLLEKPLW